MTDKSIENAIENKLEIEEAKQDEKIESGETAKKKTPTKKSPRKPPQKKTTPTTKKNQSKKASAAADAGPPKVTGRSKKGRTNWSDVIYGFEEKYKEGDVLAVRAPKESGAQFWLCSLDGVGTDDDPKNGLEITWYELQDNAYVEGEEDDISADTVICRTRLNAGTAANTYLLPAVELKSIRDALKLEGEDSSTEQKEFSDDDGSESIKENDGTENQEEEEGEDGQEPRERKQKTTGEKKRKNSSTKAEGEPKPKRQYKRKEKAQPATADADDASTTTTTVTTQDSSMVIPTEVSAPVISNAAIPMHPSIPNMMNPTHLGLAGYPLNYGYGMVPMGQMPQQLSQQSMQHLHQLSQQPSHQLPQIPQQHQVSQQQQQQQPQGFM
jgi:hypothetical protein